MNGEQHENGEWFLPLVFKDKSDKMYNRSWTVAGEQTRWLSRSLLTPQYLHNDHIAEDLPGLLIVDLEEV